MTVPDPAAAQPDGAAELAAAGYTWEMADAPVLHADLTLVDLAHVLALREGGDVPEAAALDLLRELLALVGTDPAAVAYEPSLGEPYLAREQHLVARIGPSAGWLRTGRTRREAVRTAFRMATRRAVLDVVDAGTAVVLALAAQGEHHAGTIAPDHTYLQVAEPTSFGHYLLGFADAVLRDLERLGAEFAHLNRSIAGSGAVAGSSVLRDRERLGVVLGFDGPVEHVRDGMWSLDPFTHSLAAATTLVLGIDRLAEDLEILTSAEFGLVRLGPSLVRTSVAMPQKRNPYALTVIRGTAGILVGRTTGQLALGKSPSARSDPSIYAYGEVPRSLDLAARCARLAAAVVRTLEVDDKRMAAAARAPGMEAATLAGLVARLDGADYRTAHAVVRASLARASDEGRQVTAADLDTASLAATGVRTSLTQADVDRARDPAAAVEARDVLGGSSRRAVVEQARRVRAAAEQVAGWASGARSRTAAGESAVVESARAVLAGATLADREHGGAR